MLLYSNLDFLFVFRSEYISPLQSRETIALSNDFTNLHVTESHNNKFVPEETTSRPEDENDSNFQTEDSKCFPTLCTQRHTDSETINVWLTLHVTSFTELKWLIKVTSDWYN